MIFQEMEPYLPVTSKCARFCLSAATVLFWVTECTCVVAIYSNTWWVMFLAISSFTCVCVFVCVCVCVCVCSSTDFPDSGLYHRGHSVQAGRVCCLREHHQRPNEEDPGGGQVHHSTAGDLCHGLLHQLCHHHDPQLLLWEGGRVDHWYG